MSEESRRAWILRRKDTYEDLLDDVREYIGMPLETKDRISQAVCRLAAQQLAEHPDKVRLVRWEEPMPESSRLIWERLMAQYRRDRPCS